MKKIFPIWSIAALSVFCTMQTGVARPIEMPLPPHVYTGRVLDSDAGNLASTRARAEVRARKADGTLLARSKVVVFAETICNYALTIPMGSHSSASYAVQGEHLTFEVDNGSEVFVISNAFPAVGSPGRVTHVNLVAATDANGNRVADSYEEDLAYYMAESGIEGEFSCDADYDGDGVSNYGEYLAGTDPLSPGDSLRILALEKIPGAPGFARISFLPGYNRTYSVQSSTNILGRTGCPFRLIPHFLNAVAGQQGRTFLQTDSSSSQVHFLYLLQEGDRAFYRLHLE